MHIYPGAKATMRKITRQAVTALMRDYPYRNGNTEVLQVCGGTALELHGNRIAMRRHDGTIEITNKGWFTNTTKERLNGIEGVSITQKAGVWYLNGKEWDGNYIDIVPSTN